MMIMKKKSNYFKLWKTHLFHGKNTFIFNDTSELEVTVGQTINNRKEYGHHGHDDHDDHGDDDHGDDDHDDDHDDMMTIMMITKENILMLQWI